MKSGSTILRASLWIWGMSLFCALALYYVIRAVNDYSPFAFQAFFVWGWYNYVDLHPIPYILAITISFSTISTCWLIFLEAKRRWLRLLQISIIPIITLLPAGALCGLIGTFHDMQAGYFPRWDILVRTFCDGYIVGMIGGPVIAFASFPLNIVSYIFAIGILYVASYWSERRKSLFTIS